MRGVLVFSREEKTIGSLESGSESTHARPPVVTPLFACFVSLVPVRRGQAADRRCPPPPSPPSSSVREMTDGLN